MAKPITYAQSGVNIDASDRMEDLIYPHVASTFGPRVMALKGGFAGLFRLDYDERLFKRNYKNPLLVACTDGVGSKVLLASAMNRFDTVGIDLVAMNVNDMLVLGAEPLFFLDYIALNKLDPYIVAEMVKGVAKGCRIADCALIGGETAEMPDTYKTDDFDMAGFAVGIVERKKIVAGVKNVRKGDVILGLASSGLHSNGYALARNICFKVNNFQATDNIPELDGRILGDVLLEPTKIYVRPIIRLLSQYKVKKVIHGMANITGAGLPGNITRVIPKNFDAVLKKSSWPVPPVFKFLAEKGPVEEEEMFRVFNMGIGFVLVVAEDFADSIAGKLTGYGEKVYKIGRITSGSGNVIIKD
ncbi:MAG: phosphoribosylformylglycinamidine cyclo-ligase [Sedimentisphaerales bacterium]|nr:phosphoribosylformylglycinamidine cyclo-ligase [Sedimentisphaerales bacterium]